MRIHDGGGKSACECHGKEGRVDHVTRGKSEGDVGNTERGVTAKLMTDQIDSAQRFDGRIGIGADGKG